MRKIVLAFVALGVLGLAVPMSPASAEEGKIVIKTGHDRDRDHWRRDRAESRFHRRDRDRVVIIKKRHHDRD